MKDKNGRFIRCYHCRKIALKKLMIACDYCSLYWHLDCLTPPMAGPPNSSRRWRCPNHIENVIVRIIHVYLYIYILTCILETYKTAKTS